MKGYLENERDLWNWADHSLNKSICLIQLEDRRMKRKKREDKIRLYLLCSLRLCTLLFSCFMFCQVCMCMDGQTERMFNCINSSYRRNQLGDDLYAVHMSWEAEQRKVFRLLGLSPNNAVCHRLILIQQKCKGRSLLPTFLPNAAAPTIPFSAPRCFWQLFYVSTHMSVCEQVCLCGVFCVVPLPVGSDASQIEFQREKGIERCFMLLTTGWCSELNELNWQCDKEPITS